VISSLSIERLRGIRHGILKDLTPLVVLVGRNGSGKSTVLDALMLATLPSPSQAIVRAVGRRKELPQAARWLLWRTGDEGPAEITVSPSEGPQRTAVLRRDRLVGIDSMALVLKVDGEEAQGIANYPGDPAPLVHDSKLLSPQHRFSDVRLIEFQPDGHAPLHVLYTEALRVGRRHEVRQLLAEILPGLEDIQILTEGDQPVVHLLYPWGSVPAAMAGDGILSLVIFSLEMAARPGGVVLLEEPEVYQHPAALRQSARAIWAAVRRDVQVILSTHSLDLIDYLLNEATDEDLGRLSLFRLLLDDKGELQSTRIEGPDVAFARGQIGDDLR
jgi:energy-coupling factor transporter ATP-binding protein EcfA2